MKKHSITFIGFVALLSLSSCQGNNISSSIITAPSSIFSSANNTSSEIVSSSGGVSSISSENISSSSSTNHDSKLTIDDCVSTDRVDYFKNKGYNSLYKDPNFRRGFVVTKNSTTAEGGPYYSDPLKAYDNTSLPAWYMVQWATKYDIYQNGYTVEKSEDELEYLYSSNGPTIDGKVVPAKRFGFNSKTGGMYLECNTEVEYDQPRTGSEPWVHLLYEQNFSSNLVNLSKQSSIIMEATYTVNLFENHMGEAENPNCHAAELVWYITLQNRNKESDSYGSYIWFGLMLWDNRTTGKKTNLYAAHDIGTSTMIYNPSSTKYLFEYDGIVPKVGEKVSARIDLLSIAREAFKVAEERHYLGSTKFEDLCIGGTNFGYEMPGTYHIATTFDSIGIYYK